jgi:hypothetical protein
VDYAGFAQRCPPEAERLKQTYDALIGKTWIDRKGAKKAIGIEDTAVRSQSESY